MILLHRMALKFGNLVGGALTRRRYKGCLSFCCVYGKKKLVSYVPTDT